MIDAKSIIYKTSIGHYGGTYIYLPEDKLEEFKAMFPKGTFPRNIEIKDIQSLWTEYGVKYFHEKFPNSNRVAIVHFADQSKGQKFLEDNIEVPPFND